MRSPYRDIDRAFWSDAALENHASRNHVLYDQNEMGNVAQGHKGFDEGHALQVIAVQYLRGLDHQALRYGKYE